MTLQQDLYDLLEEAEGKQGLVRRCPRCSETDVKYALHSGCKLSVQCNDCKCFDWGFDRGADLERMVNEWHGAHEASRSGGGS